MSGTSQCEMSEPNIARSRAPNGLSLVLNALAVSGSSASHPKKKLRTKRSWMSCSVSISQAAHSSRSSGRSAARAAGARRRVGARGAAVLREQLAQQLLVDALGVEVVERAPVALLPVADDVGVERDAPRHAALEEPERQVGEAAGHAAHEQRLARARAGPRRGDRGGCTCSSRSTRGCPTRWSRSGTTRRRRAPGTSPTPGRSRTRCRCRTCRSTARTARARDHGRRRRRRAAARSRRAAPP